MSKLKNQLEQKIREMDDFDELRNHIEIRSPTKVCASNSWNPPPAPSSKWEFTTDCRRPQSADRAQELSKLPNKLSIEGHTDSKPYAASGN